MAVSGVTFLMLTFRRTAAALQGEENPPIDSALAEKGRLQQRFEATQTRAESVSHPAVSPAESC